MSAVTYSLNTLVQLAVPPAFAASVTLRWLYLRAVRRSMLHSVTAQEGAAPVPPPSQGSVDRALPPIAIVPADTPERSAVRAAWRGPQMAVAVHLAAGLIYAVTVTSLWAWIAVGSFSWQGILLFSLFFVWPTVIVIGLVATVSWLPTAIVALVYGALFVGGVFWLTADTGITLPQIGLNWWNMNGLGTILVLAFLWRPIKAIGPILVALMMAAVAGVFEMAAILSDQSMAEWVALIAGNLGLSGVTGGVIAGVVVLMLAALAAVLICYVALRVVGLLYQVHWISDQSIQIDAVRLIFAILQAPPSQPLAGLAAFAASELVVRIAGRLLRPGAVADARAPRLLLLRVFALGKRSERLFHAFSLLWRHTGSMRMIAGPDLANATVEPHEFLDFMAGRLQRRFITGPAALEQRLRSSSDDRRDPDGRFRVASFFCHADTWQTVLRRLTRESDVVMMDLRGFSRSNQGCIYELNELLDAVRLQALLLIVDGTTDEDLLREVLEQGWNRISASSPNRVDAAPRVHMYRFDGDIRTVDQLVATLAAAHSRSAPFQGTSP